MRIFAFISAAVLVTGAAAAPSGDPAAGQKLFRQNCSVCHSTKENAAPGVGPNLFGVLGRKAGSLPDYSFSKAMVAFGQVWEKKNLALYLANPATVVHGNKMGFPGLKDPQKIDDIIAYLETLK